MISTNLGNARISMDLTTLPPTNYLPYYQTSSGSVRLTNFMQILCNFSGPGSSPKNHANYPKLFVIITYYKQLNYNLLISACQASKDI
jgi:hypothetical protein